MPRLPSYVDDTPAYHFTKLVEKYGSMAAVRRALGFDELPRNATKGGMGGALAARDDSGDSEVALEAIKILLGKLDAEGLYEMKRILADATENEYSKGLAANDRVIRGRRFGRTARDTALPTGVASPEERFGLAR